jgi:hypothetical protein
MSDEKVVPLFGRRPQGASPPPTQAVTVISKPDHTTEIIERLERLIDEVRTGNVPGLAFTYYTTNGGTRLYWSSNEDEAVMGHCINMLNFCYMKSCDEGMSDV